MNWRFNKNNQFGYYEVLPKPTLDELRDYYAKKYYQDEKASYSYSYSNEETQYFLNKIDQKNYIIESINKNQNNTLLDIGCGEGFTLDYYKRKGMKVLGLDFSDFGLNQIHPHLSKDFRQGNIFDEIDFLLKEGQKFDIIWVDNVLEHVVDPGDLLKRCFKLANDKGILVIEVPNDYSKLQQLLEVKGKINRRYWEAYPDHLTYFSRESLVKLCDYHNWKTEKVIADFPIEWYLMNDFSNYVMNSDKGSQAHQSRVMIENFLHDTNTDMSELIAFYEAMSVIGQGRQLIGFFTKNT